MRHIQYRLATVLSVIGAAALAVACGPEQESPPPADDALSSCTGGSSDTGGSSTGGSSTGGSSTGGTSTGGWGGRSGSGGSGGAACNTLANIGAEVTPVADPGPIPEMTGGEIVDGLYVVTSVVNYDGASADPTTLKQTTLITDNGRTAQQVQSIGGGPDVHRTITRAPSGNELNSSVVCPEPDGPNRSPYTATPNSLTIFVEQAGTNLVVTFTRPDCIGPADNHFCAPSGFPFVQRAFAVSEACPGDDCHPPNPSLTQPEPGTLCMSGTVPEGGWHGIRISFFLPANQDGSELVSAFDADALGITQVSFTIDSPPASGITVDFTNIVPHDCAGPIFDCLAFGFALPLITEPGTTTVPLTDFAQGDPASPNQTFDTSSLGGIAFGATGGAYDFCVRDFKFLDAAGDEVTP